MRELIRSAERATTDPVMVEVIGGGRSEIEAKQLTRLLASATYQAQRPQEDILGAADIYRSCRAAGETVRSLDDCLVAAIAIRHHVGVLHCDGEFDVIAHHVPLTAARA